MYLTLNLVNTDPDGEGLLQRLSDARRHCLPFIVDGTPYQVVQVETGAILMQRAAASEITSVVLSPIQAADVLL